MTARRKASQDTSPLHVPAYKREMTHAQGPVGRSLGSPVRRTVVKTLHRASIMALALVGLGGCAGMQDRSAMYPNQVVDDAAYVAQVEQMARARGVSVRWVNPPQKRVKDLQQN